MKVLIWLVVLTVGVYGGILLMPYKVVDINLSLASIFAFVLLVVGVVSGLLVSKYNHSSGLVTTMPVAIFFTISGLLGSSINFIADIKGFPLLAVLALTYSVGMFSFWQLWGKRRTS